MEDLGCKKAQETYDLWICRDYEWKPCDLYDPLFCDNVIHMLTILNIPFFNQINKDLQNEIVSFWPWFHVPNPFRMIQIPKYRT